MQIRTPRNQVDRRRLLRSLSLGSAAATVSGLRVEQGDAATKDAATKDKERKARYQPNSPDIQAYYRVNRYPMK